MSFGTTPLSTTTIGVNQFPISAVYVQGTSGGNFTALQGGPVSSADVNNNVSAPMAIYEPDGNNVALGTTTDASTANTLIGLTKAIKANTASITIGSGVVTANQGGSWTITANIGTTNGLALDTSVNGLLVSQGSSTSGEKGPLVQGAVTTSAPTYTTGQTSPISLTPSGAMRVDASATVQPVSGTFWQTTQPISVASLPLPTGAATSAKQPALGSAGSASADVLTIQGIASMTPIKTDGSGVTQPISGTVTATQATGSNLHTVVDSGAITATTNADTSIGGTSAPSKGLLLIGKSNDGTPQYQPLPEGPGGRSIIVEGNASGTALPVSGTFWQATQPVSGTVTVQQSTASSLKVDLSGTAANATAIKVDGSGVTQPISGSVTVSQSTGTNLHTVVDSGTVTANAGTGTFTNQQSNVQTDYDTSAGTQNVTLFGMALPASGGAVAGGTSSNPLRTDPTGTTTQPVSAASLPLPTGAATSAKQPALGTAGSASSDVLTVQGIASMTALKVDGSGVTQPVSGTVTANAGSGNFTVVQATGSNLHTILDSGSTTAVTQATASNLNAQVVGVAASGASNSGNPVKIGGAFNTTQPTVTTGQAVDAQMTARGAQIVATGVDTFSVSAAQSGTWNITNVSGTVSLPTGAATSAKQPALGTAGSASTDVLTVQGIASMTALKVDGSAVTQPVSGTITANQGSANATPWNENIAQFGGSSVSLGSKTSASSIPVVIASDQSALSIQHGNVVDASNSSTTTLTANSVFTGTGTSSLNYSALAIEVYADQASAANGLSIQQSQDNSHWDLVDTFSVSASTVFNTIVNLIGQYYRVVYTNGGTNQGTFRLQTIKMVADAVLPRTLTSAGNLRVDGSSVTQPVSGTVNAAQSGTWTVQPGNTANTTPWLSTINQGGNSATVTASNALKVDGSGVTQPVSGTVTANIGTSGSLALDATVAKLNVAQGATLGSNTGPMLQGSVTTNAPTYTTGNINPLSLDTSGLLRASLKDTPSNTNNLNVNLAASAATVTVSASNLQTNLNQIAGSAVATAATGIQKIGLTDGSGNAITSTSNAIDVNIKSGGGSGFSVTDEATWTAGTSSFAPTGGVFNDSAAALTSGQQGSARLTNNRAIHVNLRDASANQLLGSKTSANSLPVVIASDQGAVTVSGTVTANAGTGTFTNQQTNNTADYDTSAGTQTMTMFGMALPASGGAVAGGTSSNPIKIDPTGTTTQPVSGTITANAGTGSFTVAQATGSNLHAVLDSGSTTAVTQATASNLNAQVVGAAASGASQAGNPVKIGGAFNTTQPTVTTGQAVDAQMTARGAQIVATGVDTFSVSAAQSGTWNITNVSGTVSLPTGAATSAKQPALGTAGSASSDVLTVQGIASMTALKVDGSAVTQPVSGTVTANIGTSGSLALDATVAKLNVAQAAALGSNTGPMMQGSVTTNAPSYTTGNINPLSLDTSGLLRASLKDTPSNTNNLNVNLAASAATVTVSASNLQTNLNQIAGSSVATASTGVQKVGVTDSLGQAQYNFPAGFVRTSDEPRQIFYDPFDSTLDTTNRWNAAVNSGGGVAAAVASGVLTLGTGTTASGYSYLQSQNSTTPTIPGWLGTSQAIKLTDGAAPTANTYRFWGCGTIPGTPTTSAPLTDAYGFELDTSGKMWAVSYAAGTRTAIQDLSSSGNSKQPLDANYHRYIVYYRTDKIYFYIDGLDSNSLVATANFTGPTVQTLPISFLTVAASSAPSSSGVINCTGIAQWDTAKNNATLSDGTFGWRKATVKKASTAAASTDTALVVGLHPSSPLPSGSNTIGAVTQASGPWTSNLTQVNSTTVVTGGTSGLLAVGGSVASGSSNANNPVKTGAVYNSTQPTVTTGQIVDMQSTARGAQIVATGVDAFNVTATQSGTWTAVPNAATSGGTTPSHTMSAASTNATSLKASAGMVYGLSVSNNNASARYFKLYNKASSPTVGTDTPVLTLQVPANGTVIRAYPVGLALGTGIAWACTGGIQDSDTTAIGANDCSIDIDYK